MKEQNEQELFKLVSPYKPTGDQPEAIAKLVEGIQKGDKEQTLLGVTGSGQDIHHGQSHCKGEQADAGAGPQ